MVVIFNRFFFGSHWSSHRSGVTTSLAFFYARIFISWPTPSIIVADSKAELRHTYNILAGPDDGIFPNDSYSGIYP
jgi:hypothetical protein